jgi:exonuclease SbcD
MIRILHFADLHLGVENYSRIDPATGLSTCFGDFQASLDQVVEFALDNKIDLVLFCGDAYKSREPSQTHQREFARRIRKLAAAGIPVFLLVGNHDLPNAISRATTVEIFDTLAIENVVVADQSDIYRIETKDGLIQIVALPWLRRSTLLSREETRHLSLEGINRRLEAILAEVIKANIERLDPDLPAILAAHVSLANAVVGSEKMMMIGQEPVLPQSSIAKPVFDYVALGHIHKSQILSYNPPLVYPGSLQRIDFSDEEDIKGFYVVEIEPKGNRGKRVAFNFHPVKARRFLTIKVNILSHDLNPAETILQAIARREQEAKEAIVRVQVTIPEHIEGLVQEQEIHRALREAQYVSIVKEVERERRTRLSGWSVEEMSPAEALKVYLGLKKTPPGQTKVLLEYGEKLIQETTAED